MLLIMTYTAKKPFRALNAKYIDILSHSGIEIYHFTQVRFQSIPQIQLLFHSTNTVRMYYMPGTSLDPVGGSAKITNESHQRAYSLIREADNETKYIMASGDNL